MPEPGSRIHAVLLAGGMGARLWPISRELFPKQLVRFFGNRSLIQHTIERLHPVIPPSRLTVVCGSAHRHEISRQIRDLGLNPKGKILCEPCGRNTAPAILLALLTVTKTGKDPVVCVFPSDHVIGDVKRFHEHMASAIRLAEQGAVVTFGITPHYPETGYGYIEGGKKAPEGARRIRRFVEKPDEKTALRYFKTKRFFWNSGMFAFKASVMLEEFKTLQPEMVRRMARYIQSPARLRPALYEGLENISIDYAVMEHTRKGVVLPSDFGWSDVGSWKSLFDFLQKDENGNILNGDILARETRRCLIMGGMRLVVTNHLRDTVVVETPDSIFVSSMENSREVKSIVKQLKDEGRKESMHHQTQALPWGSRTVLEASPDLHVRRIDVFPRKTYAVTDKNGWTKRLFLISGNARIRQKPKTDVLSWDPGHGALLVSGPTRVENVSDKNLRIIEVAMVDTP